MRRGAWGVGREVWGSRGLRAALDASGMHGCAAPCTGTAAQEMLAAGVQLEAQTSISIIELCAEHGELEQASVVPLAPVVPVAPTVTGPLLHTAARRSCQLELRSQLIATCEHTLLPPSATPPTRYHRRSTSSATRSASGRQPTARSTCLSCTRASSAAAHSKLSRCVHTQHIYIYIHYESTP